MLCVGLDRSVGVELIHDFIIKSAVFDVVGAIFADLEIEDVVGFGVKCVGVVEHLLEGVAADIATVGGAIGLTLSGHILDFVCFKEVFNALLVVGVGLFGDREHVGLRGVFCFPPISSVSLPAEGEGDGIIGFVFVGGFQDFAEGSGGVVETAGDHDGFVLGGNGVEDGIPSDGAGFIFGELVDEVVAFIVG